MIDDIIGHDEPFNVDERFTRGNDLKGAQRQLRDRIEERMASG
jgi:hypothetical protein